MDQIPFLIVPCRLSVVASPCHRHLLFLCRNKSYCLPAPFSHLDAYGISCRHRPLPDQVCLRIAPRIRSIGIYGRGIRHSGFEEVELLHERPCLLVRSCPEKVSVFGPSCNDDIVADLSLQCLRPVAVCVEVAEEPECGMPFVVLDQVCGHLQGRVYDHPVCYLPCQRGLYAAFRVGPDTVGRFRRTDFPTYSMFSIWMTRKNVPKRSAGTTRHSRFSPRSK